MANKRLAPSQVEEMKNMVIQGVYPEDIANHFNIAVSSVHNYKTRFKEDGVKFPSVKGKRPAGAIKPEDTLTKSVKQTIRPDINLSKRNQTNITGVLDGYSDNVYKFIVNGVSVEIASGAKYVNIGKDSMEIRF